MSQQTDRELLEQLFRVATAAVARRANAAAPQMRDRRMDGSMDVGRRGAQRIRRCVPSLRRRALRPTLGATSRSERCRAISAGRLDRRYMQAKPQ